MLRRFSLYGFLKNQKYYEPFIVLAFLQMGLSYTLIGLLIAFRAVMVNLMEIPSGAIADLLGRRRSMIFSFGGYIISFAVLGSAGLAAGGGGMPVGILMPILMVAMMFFSIGEAFRTGTHKAMIFAWLRCNGRIDERTKVYGYTRSWSKIGSAVSVVIAGILVFLTSNYVFVFFFSIIPYILNIINFLGYPRQLDGSAGSNPSPGQVAVHLKESLGLALGRRSLRRLILESMGYEGFFSAGKDYLQPLLRNAAIPLTAMMFTGLAMSEHQRSVILIVPVYFVLFLLSAFASRNAHRFVKGSDGEDRTARQLWAVVLVVLGAMIPAMYFGMYPLVIIGFVVLYALQNIWRPVLISRFDRQGDEARGATILSIESQAKSAATMVIAPALGVMVDTAKARGIGATPFWPVAVVGALLALGFLLSARTELVSRGEAAVSGTE
jgi:MFS family permease